MYPATKAAQRRSFPPMETLGNHSLTFQVGQQDLRVLQAVVVILILPFHFLSGTHSAARRLVEQ